jgi:hypothetical protein
MAYIEGEQEYLKPANCTDLMPPAEIDKIARFVDGAWILIDDPRVIQQKEEALIAEEKRKQDAITEALILQQQQKRQAKLASASNKLKALGLTDDEIAALLGS